MHNGSNCINSYLKVECYFWCKSHCGFMNVYHCAGKLPMIICESQCVTVNESSSEVSDTAVTPRGLTSVQICVTSDLSEHWGTVTTDWDT